MEKFEEREKERERVWTWQQWRQTEKARETELALAKLERRGDGGLELEKFERGRQEWDLGL